MILFVLWQTVTKIFDKQINSQKQVFPDINPTFPIPIGV